jgi:hypothetical protein
MLRSERAVELQESESPIGWRIQRLDVYMRDQTENPGLIMDILADILRRLPNLRVLAFAITGNNYDECLPENVLQATNACRDTLRLLNWYRGVRLSSNSWVPFLENHPRLEAIDAPVVLTQLQVENSHIVLDSLKSIYVRCQNPASRTQNMLWNIDFPSIHHAIYEITSPPHSSNDVFLQRQGSKLTSIEIIILSNDLDFAFSKIVTTCKNLARVDLVIFEWLMPSFSIPKSVHTLGIRVRGRGFQIPKRSMLEAFFLSIRNVLSSFPSVKTICFTDQQNIRALRVHSQALSSNLVGIHNLGVDVMDHEGRLLVVEDGNVYFETRMVDV